MVFLAVLGAMALGAWASWVARGEVELAVAQGRAARPAPSARGAGAGRRPRAWYPPAARHELETRSLARWLFEGGNTDSPERGPSR